MTNDDGNFKKARRNFLRGLGMSAAVAAQPAWGGQTFADRFRRFLPERLSKNVGAGNRGGTREN